MRHHTPTLAGLALAFSSLALTTPAMAHDHHREGGYHGYPAYSVHGRACRPYPLARRHHYDHDHGYHPLPRRAHRPWRPRDNHHGRRHGGHHHDHHAHGVNHAGIAADRWF